MFTNTDDKKRYKIYTTLSLRKKRNYLLVVAMAKNKTVLQTHSFAFGESEVSFASECLFTTLPVGRRLWTLWISLVGIIYIWQ